MLRELMGKMPLVKGENLSLGLSAIVVVAREKKGEGPIGILESVAHLRENVRISHKDALTAVFEVAALLCHLSLVGTLNENLCFEFTDLGRIVLQEVWKGVDAEDMSSPEARAVREQVSRMMR